MDLQKEREAFEAVTNTYHCIYNADLNYYFSGSKFVGDKAEIEVNAGWKAWQAKSQAVPEWISVKNAMPKAGSQVLTYDDYGFVSVENIDGCEDPNNVYFSHWLPLPPVEQEPAND